MSDLRIRSLSWCCHSLPVYITFRHTSTMDIYQQYY